jgi:uncharacterized protein YbjT (DUF2867 family)
MKIIITGASGMVGEGVLQECLSNPFIKEVVVVGRKPCGYSHEKLAEILHSNFNDISTIVKRLEGFDACFFCAGVSSVGLSAEVYYELTYSLTINFASQLAKYNPQMTFCYVSGGGTDSTEKGRLRWARVKGKTENDLTKLPFKAVYNFRPGAMKTTKGAKNFNKFLKAIEILYPLFKLFNSPYYIPIATVAKAMILVSKDGYPAAVLEAADIKKLGES